MANFVAVLIARTAALGVDARREGIGAARLTGYAASGVHLCVARAFDMAGLGSDALRLIPCDDAHPYSICRGVAESGSRWIAPRAFTPFLAVGTAGSVDVGAIDDLGAIANVCHREDKMWFHVDAAFGAIRVLSRCLRPDSPGMERANYVAFDFHKWAQVPYDAGCIVVRDPTLQRAALREVGYLARETRGLAAGEDWPSGSRAGVVAGIPGAESVDDACGPTARTGRRGRRAEL